jgi:hypothetical protein
MEMGKPFGLPARTKLGRPAFDIVQDIQCAQ